MIIITLVEASNVFDYSMVNLELLEQPLRDKVFRCSIPTSILPLNRRLLCRRTTSGTPIAAV